MKNFILKEKLDFHYKAFDKSQISPDPLQFLHLYNDVNDIEIAGFISSVFAYGNVRQIINTLNSIFNILGTHPYAFIRDLNKNLLPDHFGTTIHRFYTSKDIQLFFIELNSLINKEGTLKDLFMKFYLKHENDRSLKIPLSEFSNYFISSLFKKYNQITPGCRFMFADPLTGSACKRMNLFLRWMVRKDDLDFGFWNDIPANKLVIPVDTHVARICRELKLTGRKNVSWKMAEEITDNLKKFDPADPVKYDFAICHIGMRKMIL
ncbi:MAG: TIGR02757 family protein [Ignavibacteriaceae bacterium]